MDWHLVHGRFSSQAACASCASPSQEQQESDTLRGVSPSGSYTKTHTGRQAERQRDREGQRERETETQTDRQTHAQKHQMRKKCGEDTRNADPAIRTGNSHLTTLLLESLLLGFVIALALRAIPTRPCLVGGHSLGGVLARVHCRERERERIKNKKKGVRFQC